MMLPPVIGHRGAARFAPENTLAGIRRGAELGARMVEFDVQPTRDGVVVLMHDTTVDRTSNGTGPVAEMTHQQFAGLDAGSWFSPEFAGEPAPTLVETLTLCGELGLRANVEIKPDLPDVERAVDLVLKDIEAVWSFDASGPVISSFSPDVLRVCRQRSSGIPLGVLVWKDKSWWPELAADIGAMSVHFSRRNLRKTDVEAALQADLKVAVYTVNDPPEARKLFGWGVTAVFTDDPAAILAVADPA
ncbi:MAG: glycerophosphoryl diester phosphodiesterase [Rhodospirillales bacterium]